jgi:hypothetical protein
MAVSSDPWLAWARAGTLATALLVGGGLFYFRAGHSYAPADVSPVHARHARDCRDCHVPWRGATAERCWSCHTSWPSGKSVLATLHQKTQAAGVRCWRCHTEHSGDRLTHPFEHAALPGATAAACVGCHARPTDAVHQEAPDTCARCHETAAWRPARFAHDTLTSGGAGRCGQCHQAPRDRLHVLGEQGCDRCHSTSAWQPAQFDHARFFPLVGEHNAPCSTCHPPPKQFSAYTCYGCHEHTPDRILEEHREEGIADIRNCVGCHRSGGKHDGDSRERARGGFSGEERQERGHAERGEHGEREHGEREHGEREHESSDDH